MKLLFYRRCSLPLLTQTSTAYSLLRMWYRTAKLVDRHSQELQGLKGSMDLAPKSKHKHHDAGRRGSRGFGAGSKRESSGKRAIAAGAPNIDVKVEKGIAPNLAKYLSRLKDQRQSGVQLEKVCVVLAKLRGCVVAHVLGALYKFRSCAMAAAAAASGKALLPPITPPPIYIDIPPRD